MARQGESQRLLIQPARLSRILHVDRVGWSRRGGRPLGLITGIVGFAHSEQNHGYGDCRSTCFRAFEAHVNFCLTAYNLQRCNESGIPKPGTSITEYIGVRKLQDGAHTINQFNGVQRFKRAASEALAEMTIRKVA